MPRRRFACALVLAFTISSLLVFADDENEGGHHHHAEQLGSVHFAVSCSPQAQASFDRGMAWLHSFGYEAAEAEFQRTASLDGQCAMAEWGVAMSRWHELWDPPEKEDISIARAALAKAAKMREKSPREQEYIAAIGEFYRGDQRDHAQRADAYTQKMAKLHQDYPDDNEASIFYALSLMASMEPNDVERRKQVAAILEPIFDKEPQHPGPAHYLIHAYDNPQLAAQGLNAARKYARIAPASVHALHMPSHIFVQLGLWQESIDSNLAALNASYKQEKSEEVYGNQLHSIDFIVHSAVQIGRDALARQYIAQAQQIATADEHMKGDPQVGLPGMYAMETHDWRAALSLTAPKDAPADELVDLYSYQTIAAARLGDVALAQKDFALLQQAVEQAKTSKDPMLYYMSKNAERALVKPQAWLEFAQGKPAAALSRMQEAAAREHLEGAGFAVPAEEMMGDMLVEMKRPADALAHYRAALKLSPNRFNSLYGAAHAAELAGDAAAARQYYTQLVSNCAGADSTRPELAAAKSYLDGGSAAAAGGMK